MTELIVAFQNFENMPENSNSCLTEIELRLHCGHKTVEISRIYRSSVIKITQNT